MRLLIKWVRDMSSRFFCHFGIHCATHQIRLILISGLVITSLFYPALAIYSNVTINLRSHILDYVYTPEIPSDANLENDLVRIWTRSSALQLNEDPVARARCGTERTIRIERILVSGIPSDDDTGAVNRRTLLACLHLEGELRNQLTSQDAPCLPSDCSAISPLLFWDHNEQSILVDTNLLWTLNRRENVSVAGLPVTANMVLSGRDMDEQNENVIDYAHFLSVSFLFREDNCDGSIGHNEWIRALEDAMPSFADIKVKVQEPVLIALEFNPDMVHRHHISALKILLYLSYLVFFIYFSGSMRRMDTVHSRIGLCFTGLVEVIVSTITSLSVCALAGLRLTMIPWGIFPIVIVFVGAENMFRLIDDVVKTPISLPVKERIGVGLSRAGTSNTFKVVSYNAIIGVIGFFAHGVIRQLCVFAIVVLVAHWFLIHTFFVAVLSIDIQRLELNDLIRQGVNATPALGNKKRSSSEPASRHIATTSPLQILKGITKGRVTKNVSLLLLLTFTGALYYSTLPPSSNPSKFNRLSTYRPSGTRIRANPSKVDEFADARHIWRVLNPMDDPLLHLRLEAPAIVTLNSPEIGINSDSRSLRSRWPGRTLRPLWWIFKIMVLPIGATLSCLYMLLLYLLKGTEQLDNRVSQDGEGDVTIPVKGTITLKTFPRPFATDVALLGSDELGSLVLSASADGDAFAWFCDTGKCVSVDVDDLILRKGNRARGSMHFTCATVARNGSYCAIGTATGVIGVWKVEVQELIPLAPLHIDSLLSPVIQMEFKVGGAKEESLSPGILACYRSGVVINWTCLDGIPTRIQPSRSESIGKVDLLRPSQTGTQMLALFCMDDGRMEIIDTNEQSDDTQSLFSTSRGDDMAIADVKFLEIEGSSHLLLATASRYGSISLHDITMGERIINLEEAHGTINQIRISPLSPKPCTQCGETPLCDFLLSYQVGSIIHIDHGRLAQRCSCPIVHSIVPKAPLRDAAMGRRSRSSSFVSSTGADSPLRPPRSRLTSFSGEVAPGATAFPVSGHGMHSRRLSEKDGIRRTSDKHDKIADHDDSQKLHVPNGSHSRTSSDASITIPDRWQNFRLVKVRQMSCERGGWDVMGGTIMGIRRKSRMRDTGPQLPRIFNKTTNMHSLSSSMLDRWELWILDPLKGDRTIQASPLSAIHVPVSLHDDSSIRQQFPQLSFTRLSPVVFNSFRCLAGFGNTIGIIDATQRDLMKHK